MAAQQLDDEQLQEVYTWVDQIPLSRPKRNITRDFSDGVLAAEVVHHFYPKLVELHSYSAANSVKQKMYNWTHLNTKVFRRMRFSVSQKEIEAAVNCVPGVIEVLLLRMRAVIAERQARRSDKRSLGRTAESQGSRRSASGRMPSRAASGSVADHGGAGAGAGAEEPGASRAAAHGAGASAPAGAPVDDRLLAQKDGRIAELEETVEFLELKIRKLEQLVRLKDSRIQTLTARLQSAQ